jgi:Rrf2 family protein
MMVELTRELKDDNIVHLGRIAEITGLSENYLAQLAISLKNRGLLVGVSGKKGGYHLARPANQIRIAEIIEAVIGPINLTECVTHPEICLNSSFCETRLIWSIANYRVQEVLSEYTLADLVNKNWIKQTRKKYPEMTFLDPDVVMSGRPRNLQRGCP